MLAAGQDVDIVELIGNHECSKYPQRYLMKMEKCTDIVPRLPLLEQWRKKQALLLLQIQPNQTTLRWWLMQCLWSEPGHLRRVKTLTWQPVDTSRKFWKIVLQVQNLSNSVVTTMMNRLSKLEQETSGQCRTQANQWRWAMFSKHQTQQISFHALQTKPSSWTTWERSGYRWGINSSFHKIPKLYMGAGSKSAPELTVPAVWRVCDTHTTTGIDPGGRTHTSIILHAMYAAAVDDSDKLIIHTNDTVVVVLLLYLASSLHQAGL